MSVYFILCPLTERVKIGFAGSVEARFAKMRVDCPSDLRLLAVIDGTQADEKALHRQYAALRARGEWFYYIGELRAFIDTLPPYEKSIRRRPLSGKLGGWIVDNDLTLVDVGERLGISHASVSRLCCGKQNVSLDTLCEISRMTNGAVTADDLVRERMAA